MNKSRKRVYRQTQTVCSLLLRKVFSKVTVDGQNAESGLFVSYIYQILLNIINVEAQRMHNMFIAMMYAIIYPTG